MPTLNESIAEDAALYDTLLPKLLSGESSVADVNYSALSNSSNSRKANP